MYSLPYIADAGTSTYSMGSPDTAWGTQTAPYLNLVGLSSILHPWRARSQSLRRTLHHLRALDATKAKRRIISSHYMPHPLRFHNCFFLGRPIQISVLWCFNLMKCTFWSVIIVFACKLYWSGVPPDPSLQRALGFGNERKMGRHSKD